MSSPALDEDRLARFLVSAKRATYASQGDEASVVPLLKGSKQLEFTEGPLFYRDVYFGVGFFVGQEVVELDRHPIWSMSYAGGAVGPPTEGPGIREVYRFLREALQRVDASRPFRGPPAYRNGSLVYACEVSGTLSNFRGRETIGGPAREVYALTFAGGALR
jgi:hypothetical protein